MKPGGESCKINMNKQVWVSINQKIGNYMEIISNIIPLSKLKSDYMHYFTSVIKADVDIVKHIIAVDGDLHADLETLLLERDSLQQNIWGINLYPFKPKEEFIEFTSLINIRPAMNNFSMEIEDDSTKSEILRIIDELIDFDS